MTRGKVQVGFKAFAVLLRPWAPCRLCRQVCGRNGWMGHRVRRKLLQSVRVGGATAGVFSKFFFIAYLHPMNMRVVLASWWSKKRLLPVSSVAMVAISSSSSVKSNMSMFCCIRSMWADLGMVITPR